MKGTDCICPQCADHTSDRNPAAGPRRQSPVAGNGGFAALTFAKVPGRVQVSNESGDIKLVLPPGGTAYQANASTSSGTSVIEVPRNSSSAHVITVTDQSGNISVTR
jgi:hypothetical protein